ncbi:hypothetical protein Pmani_017327 [Petrolisthes manimaculis]|uniref:Uncharacterized protein n=1 Tax=Petrolisthes manimaculis TaxID=1843537 RepID=A0AAE1U5X8_9EUCA|nr:hypothetical protein Pmani_017327 [Petrolisthes manimaculis]
MQVMRLQQGKVMQAGRQIKNVRLVKKFRELHFYLPCYLLQLSKRLKPRQVMRLGIMRAKNTTENTANYTTVRLTIRPRIRPRKHGSKRLDSAPNPPTPSFQPTHLPLTPSLLQIIFMSATQPLLLLPAPTPPAMSYLVPGDVLRLYSRWVGG